VQAVADALDLQRMILIGHSMGGGYRVVALEVRACRAPAQPAKPATSKMHGRSRFMRPCYRTCARNPRVAETPSVVPPFGSP
jgi:hypothetical protein